MYKLKRKICSINGNFNTAFNLTVKLVSYSDVALNLCTAGPGCSKLTTSLVNVSLKFQKKVNISNMPIFFVEKM